MFPFRWRIKATKIYNPAAAFTRPRSRQGVWYSTRTHFGLNGLNFVMIKSTFVKVLTRERNTPLIVPEDAISGVNCDLTHWGWDKMTAISQTTISNVFSWMKILEFQLKFHWSLFLTVQLTIFQINIPKKKKKKILFVNRLPCSPAIPHGPNRPGTTLSKPSHLLVPHS